MRGYGRSFDDILDRSARMRRLANETRETVQSEDERPAADTAGNGPQIIAGPDSAPTKADTAAIVAAIAHKVLLGEIDWDFAGLVENNPALRGLGEAEIREAIAEAIS